jgi:hypothetical protein
MVKVKTYSSADVEAKANAHDVNLVMVGSRITSMMLIVNCRRDAVISRHLVVDGIIHWDSGATSNTRLLDMAAIGALHIRIRSIVAVWLKLDAEVVLPKCQQVERKVSSSGDLRRCPCCSELLGHWRLSECRRTQYSKT